MSPFGRLFYYSIRFSQRIPSRSLWLDFFIYQTRSIKFANSQVSISVLEITTSCILKNILSYLFNRFSGKCLKDLPTYYLDAFLTFCNHPGINKLNCNFYSTFRRLVFTTQYYYLINIYVLGDEKVINENVM